MLPAGGGPSFPDEQESPGPAGRKLEPAGAGPRHEHALEIGPARAPVLWATWAATGSVASGNREEFETLLRQTLEFDIDSEPGARLLNQVAQERAAWLLRNVDDYFLDDMQNP